MDVYPQQTDDDKLQLFKKICEASGEYTDPSGNTYTTEGFISNFNIFYIVPNVETLLNIAYDYNQVSIIKTICNSNSRTPLYQPDIYLLYTRVCVQKDGKLAYFLDDLYDINSYAMKMERINANMATICSQMTAAFISLCNVNNFDADDVETLQLFIKNYPNTVTCDTTLTTILTAAITANNLTLTEALCEHIDIEPSLIQTIYTASFSGMAHAAGTALDYIITKYSVVVA